MFMTKRTQAMYSALLVSLVKTATDRFNIVLQPTNISTDFEKAAIHALEEVFTTAVVTGCHFHLGQSVIRKVNELGLKNTYQRDKDFALKARMLYGLAYLPVGDVPRGLDQIRVIMPAMGQPLVQYFDTTYVNGLVVRNVAGDAVRHRAPMFPPSMWNVADRFVNELPTTTNHVEAWHHRIQTLMVIDHPSFFTCLHKLRQEQRHTEVQITRANSGFRRKNQRRSIAENKRRLATLMSDLRSGRKDVLHFLRGVGQLGQVLGKCNTNDNDDDGDDGDEIEPAETDEEEEPTTHNESAGNSQVNLSI